MREIVHLQTGQVSSPPSPRDPTTFELMVPISPNLTVRQPNWYDKPPFLVLTLGARTLPRFLRFTHADPSGICY